MKFFDSIFRVNRTSDEVVELLNAVLKRNISDEDWDDFISVKIVDPKLEKIRERVEEIWTQDSPYRVSGSFDPTDLNPRGITEIRKLIDSIKHN
jgi:hypothetical protein